MNKIINIPTNEIEELIKIIGNQGLGFFALYIIYHYLGQLFSAIIILKIISKIIKTIDNWICNWFEIQKANPYLQLKVGQVVKVSSLYQDKRIAGKLVKISEEFYSLKDALQHSHPIWVVTMDRGKDDEEQYGTNVPLEFIKPIED